MGQVGNNYSIAGRVLMKPKSKIASDVGYTFDEQVSLRNVKGQEDVVAVLTVATEQFLNDRTAGRNPKYVSVILFGDEGSGKRTLARSMHNSLGQLAFKEALCSYGNLDDDVSRYWTGNDHTLAKAGDQSRERQP